MQTERKLLRKEKEDEAQSVCVGGGQWAVRRQVPTGQGRSGKLIKAASEVRRPVSGSTAVNGCALFNGSLISRTGPPID